MNEQLKFSWGHIIAFLSLIFISYVTFMGITYLTDGDFLMATVGMLSADLFLIACFIGAQLLKGTDRKFENKIILERICIFSSPLVFVVVMIPFIHFWTVYEKNDTIIDRFSNAITTSKQMFVDYDQYSKTRLENYDKLIKRVLNNKRLRPDEYSEFGFSGKGDATQDENMNKALRLQLVSENYDSLRSVANDWINRANTGATVWNVFLLGNIRQIENSIDDWHNMLVDFSKKRISNEEFNGYNTIEVFDSNNETIAAVKKGLSAVNNLYTERHLPDFYSIITGIACYLMLLFPYFLQERNTKSTFRLLGREKLLGGSISMKLNNMKAVKNKQPLEETPFVFNNSNSGAKISQSHQSDDDEFYGPFTI